MTVLTRRYRFSASHRLWSEKFTTAENAAIYGKCANPFGHGHNYVLEVGAAGPVDEVTGRVVDVGRLDRLVEEMVLGEFDHRDLNTDTEAFRGVVPTTENLALEIEKRLKGALTGGQARLARLRLFETRRNSVELEKAGNENS